MRQPLFFSVLVLSCGLFILLGGCAAQHQRAESILYDDSALFPLPAGLKPNVDFWRNVYARWGRAQVAIHDDRYLDLIYQVLTLPPPIQDSYTSPQKELIAATKAHWQTQLQSLQTRLQQKVPLTREQEALKQRLIASSGGIAALNGAAQRVRSQRGLRERFQRGVEISGRYEPAIRAAFRAKGLPEDLAYLPHVESSFQTNARSTVGAAGIWQFMRSTGAQYMTVNSLIDERLDPVIAAGAATQYLGNAYAKLGYWPLALTSYNHGIGGMKRAQSQFGNDIARIVQEYDGRAFGFASRNFYAEFLAARHVATHAERYFRGALHRQPPLSVRPVRLTSRTFMSELTQRYQVPASVLIDYNLAWLDPIRTGRTAIPAGSTVWLPTATAD
ncbi:lytic transglycosylase domain-containing protein [Thiospirillum jenense]|uniref:Transglycosylase SLT domain-containing protein n=1 Tax=Thiospirillum jenense TaxID=1653858 RepID=A0A839HC77_9GAMM|nr:transglycosylase SLT domain-containing protein [Thiospirillum jenense]MBB1126144.1 transglycosylase SLT domain-containing protein [Thiospirillum jenense]